MVGLSARESEAKAGRKKRNRVSLTFANQPRGGQRPHPGPPNPLSRRVPRHRRLVWLPGRNASGAARISTATTPRPTAHSVRGRDALKAARATVSPALPHTMSPRPSQPIVHSLPPVKRVWAESNDPPIFPFTSYGSLYRQFTLFPG